MTKNNGETSIEALKANYLNDQEANLARMKEELAALGQQSKKIGTTALIVGGVLLVGYIVGRKLFVKKRNKLSGIPSTYLMARRPKTEPAIVKLIKEQMLLFLMAIVKEKLIAYIKSAENKK